MHQGGLHGSSVTLTGEGEDDDDVDKNSKQFLDHAVGESFSREVVSESPEASRDRHLDRQRPLAKSFESRERPLATGIYVARGLRRLI